MVAQIQISPLGPPRKRLMYKSSVGLTGRDQRDALSCMAFFINNNALILWLSSSSPAGTMALSKVMACSGAFSHTSSSARHFPSCARQTSLTKNDKDLMARSKRKLRTVREAGRRGVGGKKGRMVFSSPSLTPRGGGVIPLSGVFRRKYTKTQSVAVRHQDGQI